MSIVMAAVCGFIIVGSRSYAAANSDITVQSEAQLSLNQISDVLIDTTRSVNYVGYDASGSAEFALKDSEFTFDPEAKSLILYNGVLETDTTGATPTTTVTEGNGNKHYQIYWSKADETLYYAELDVQSTDVTSSDIHFPSFPDPAWVVLAEHVTDFSIDLSQMEDERVAQIAMTFVNGTKEYNTSNNITVRNKVGINDAEITSIDRSKTLSVSCRDLGVILEPGETYHFSVPTVTGRNVIDKSVKWTMDPAYAGGSYFTDAINGILKIADNEPAGEIRVVITTNAVDSDGNHATLTLPVSIKRVTDITMSKVDDEVAENGDREVMVGKKFSIQAGVNGIKLGYDCSGSCNNAEKAIDKAVINWQLDGPATRLDTNGDVLKTEYKVNDSAKEGDVITIRVTSALSAVRPYPNVEGVITLTVKKGKSGNMSLDGAIRWGKKVDVTGKYPDDFNKGGQGYFLVFARIKEDLGAPASADKIMVYRTHGMSAGLTPDLFGVEDISTPWYVSLQILDPGGHIGPGAGPDEWMYNNMSWQSSVDSSVHIRNDSAVKAIVDNYLANCDSEGTYIGTEYPHTEKMVGIIQPPQIFYEYNNKSNLDGELNLEPVSVMRGGPWDTSLLVKKVKNTRGEVDGGDYNARYVKFKVYKEQSDGRWGDPIFQYVQEDKHSHDLSAGGSWHGTQDNGAINFDITSATNMHIKVNQNNPMNAVGKYHIVPIIKYVHDPGADSTYEVYAVNYQPNYWNVQTYEVPESTIHFEVGFGDNIELKAYYDNHEFTGKGYFPLPSEDGFTDYFQREQTQKQNVEWKSFRMQVPHRNNEIHDVQYKQITCEYISTEKAYVLTFKYTDNQGREHSAGKFRCKSDGTRWEQISVQ